MTAQKVKQAVLYARISQADVGVDKPENQLAELRGIAQAYGYEVADELVDDDVSAFEGKYERPGFINLIAGLQAGRWDVVMATEPQRFTRGSAGELEALQVSCVKAGAVIHTRAAGIQDPATPMIAAMLKMQDVMAWVEVATNRERQKARNRADRAKGIPKKGTRAFGWEVDGMTLRPSEAVVIRQAYEAVIQRDATTWEIAQDWNARGIRTDGMGRMRKSKADPSIRKEAPAVWTTSTVRQILLRPRNAGILMHEGAELPESRIQPIVTRQELEAVEAALSGPAMPTGPKPQYLLGGLLLCICGERMHASKSISGRKGQKREYRIYRCRLYGYDKSKQHVTIQQPIADMVARDWIVENIGLGEDRTPAVDRARLAEVQARLAQIEAEVERGTDALMEGVGDSARIKGRLKALGVEKEGLEAERDRIRASASHSAALAAFRAKLDELPDLAPDADIDAVLAEGYEAWDALSMEDRRAIIRGGYTVKVTAGGRGPDRVKVTEK